MLNVKVAQIVYTVISIIVFYHSRTATAEVSNGELHTNEDWTDRLLNQTSEPGSIVTFNYRLTFNQTIVASHPLQLVLYTSRVSWQKILLRI